MLESITLTGWVTITVLAVLVVIFCSPIANLIGSLFDRDDDAKY